MSVINTNLHSLVAQQALATNSRYLEQSMAQLSTGKRINSAADDAAGLAISNKMTTVIRGIGQAVRNASDAISMIQTVDGAVGGITDVLQRMRELAVQASNEVYSAEDRGALQSEFAGLQAEVTRIATTTQWSGMSVTDSAAGVFNFQVGLKSADAISLTLKNVTTDVTSEAVAAGVKIDLAADAGTAIGEIDKSLANIDEYRGSLGATMNRLGYAADNLVNVSTNSAASRSRILDADYAKSTTEMARSLIIQQAATAMLTQANQQPVNVLSLLQF